MKREKFFIDGKLTGTLGENSKKKQENIPSFEQEFGEEFEPIQQMWRVNPADEDDYKGSIGYKDS